MPEPFTSPLPKSAFTTRALKSLSRVRSNDHGTGEFWTAARKRSNPLSSEGKSIVSKMVALLLPSSRIVSRAIWVPPRVRAGVG